MKQSTNLKSIGSKNTNSRQAILDDFESNTKPLSIKDVMSLSLVKSNESTVYRIVNFFVKKGVLVPVFIQKDITFYELAHLDDHHHIICTNCKKVSDFHGCAIDKITTQALKQNPNFSRVNSHSIELFGLCNSSA